MPTICVKGEQAVRGFRRIMFRGMNKIGRRKVRYSRGIFDSTVYVSGDFWCGCTEIEKDGYRKYVHAFGFNFDESNSTLFEINISVDESGNQLKWCSGLVVQDDQGAKFLVHNGIVTVNDSPSRPKAEEVREYFSDRLVDVVGVKGRRYILVTAFEEVVPHLRRFVSHMVDLKNDYRAGRPFLQGGGQEWEDRERGEGGADGRETVVEPSPYVRQLRHEQILDDFVTVVRDCLPDSEIRCNRLIDLIIQAEGKRFVAELKSGGDLQSIYTGIGQCLYHAHSRKGEPMLVLPSRPEVERAIPTIKSLGITMVVFHMEEGGYVFYGPKGEPLVDVLA